jgi:hypothetical protein
MLVGQRDYSMRWVPAGPPEPAGLKDLDIANIVEAERGGARKGRSGSCRPGRGPVPIFGERQSRPLTYLSSNADHCARCRTAPSCG